MCGIERVKYQLQGSKLTADPRPVRFPQNSFRPVQKDLNWSYRARKHLGTYLLTSFPSRMSANVYEIDEDKINQNKCFGKFYTIFFLVLLDEFDYLAHIYVTTNTYCISG